MCRRAELAAAGLIPGSMPTTGTSGKCSRQAATAATVAVLQATTISEQPRPIR